MLTYGGAGLLFAGLIMMFGANTIIKDPVKAANAKKQAPVLAVVGALALGAGLYLGGVLA